jgi:hypothetical protein
LGGDQFFAHGQLTNSRNVTPIFQYFSFTTLTTLGYGDFTAASSSGRAIAVLEAVTGQIFLATLVARLVAAFRPAADKPASPAAGSDGLKPGRPGQRSALARPGMCLRIQKRSSKSPSLMPSTNVLHSLRL